MTAAGLPCALLLSATGLSFALGSAAGLSTPGRGLAAAVTGLPCGFAHGFFHSSQDLFKTWLIAHIRQGVTRAGRVSETGFPAIALFTARTLGISRAAALGGRLRCTASARGLPLCVAWELSLREFTEIAGTALSTLRAALAGLRATRLGAGR